MLAHDQVRSCDADALVDTRAVRMVVPSHIVLRLGLGLRGQRMAEYADGRTEAVSVTEPLVVELEGRDTLEEALVLGDEVLIGRSSRPPVRLGRQRAALTTAGPEETP